MKQRTQWRPGYVVMIVAVVVVVLVLSLSYRPAVTWFNAVNNFQSDPTASAVSSEAPILPVTSRAPVPENPGFPWWAFAVIMTVMLVTLFVWRSGYKNVLAAYSRQTATAAERRARSYTFNADVYHHLNAKKTARYLRSLAGSFARTALALRNTSKFLNRIESAGAQLDLPPVGESDTSVNLDAKEYQGMPPRLDSLLED